MWYSFTFHSDGKAYCSFHVPNPHYTTEQVDPWLSYDVFIMHTVHYCETECIICYSWGLARLQYQGRVIYKRDILFKSACLIMTQKHATSTEDDMISNTADCHHAVSFHARLVAVGNAL